MSGGTSNRESDDNYRRVIVTFGNYRLIDGSCGIQWIIQKRDGHRKSGAPRWTAITQAADTEWAQGFCRSVLVQSKRRGWMPSPKQLGIVHRMTADWFAGTLSRRDDDEVVE